MVYNIIYPISKLKTGLRNGRLNLKGVIKMLEPKFFVCTQCGSVMELLKDKEPAFYYSDVLIPNGAVLNDFIKGSNLR